MRMRVVVPVAVVALLVQPVLMATEQDDAFWEAARQGDLETIEALHEQGVDVNARTRYNATALAYACDKGHLDVVRYLVENGAEINVQDSFYEFTPIGWATFNGHTDIVEYLLSKGSEGADQVLTAGVRNNDPKLVEMALKSDTIDSDHVAQALQLAASVEGAQEIVKMLQAAEVKPAERLEIKVDPQVLSTYVGTYNNAEIGMTLDVRVEEGSLVAQAVGQPPLTMRPLSDTKFEAVGMPQIKLSFEGRGGMIERAVVEQGSQTMSFPRVTAQAEASTTPETEPDEAAPPVPVEEAATPIVRTAARNWPSFRGPAASGVADGQGAPVEWDVSSGQNIRWKTPIPGLANSSPIIWGKRVFVTTAVSSAGDKTFRSGLYGDVDSVDDVSTHVFKLYSLDRDSGEVLWEKTAAEAVPGAKRHMKSTQANSTPVTDGKRVVALFGTIGLLIAYDFEGKLLWQTDLGVLDAGWFYDRSYQWGHASSPIIYKDLVIVQADVYAGSFIAAYRIKNGKQVWKTPREDIPSWGTPTIYFGERRDELITNGATIVGYVPATGKELWRLAPNSEVTVATPVVAHDLFFVTAGYPPVRPVYAIRPGASGDISLPEETQTSAAVAWSRNRGGTYMPTPIVYGDYLYTCANNGRLTCYEATTGEEVYKARIGAGGSFTASPIAADGRLYFTDESGEIYVVKAGSSYEELARNSMDEICMSTPAVSDGIMIVRTLNHVYGISTPEDDAGETVGSAR